MTTMTFRRNRPRRRAILNITSLIDVLFLLLIFFMLSSTFRSAGQLELELPESRTAGAVENEMAERNAHLALRSDGSLFLDGEPVTKTELPQRLVAFRTSHPDATVRIDAEASAQHAGVIELLDMVREAGFTGVGLGTERQLGAGNQ